MAARSSMESSFEEDRKRLEGALWAAITSSTPVETAGPAAMDAGLSGVLADPDADAGTGPDAEKAVFEYHRQLADHCLGRLLDAAVRAAATAGAPVMAHVPPGAAGGAVVPRLLDLTLALCEAERTDPGAIFAVLEHLLEGCTLADAADVFAYIERRAGSIGAPAVFARGKLIFLRTCNELQRRLSKAADTVLCGRVLMLLARLYPLSERSALNVAGRHNTANVTELDPLAAMAASDPAVAATAVDADGCPIDLDFYRTFWGLQPAFQSPVGAMGAAWPGVATALSTVLDAFDAQPLRDGAASASAAAVAASGPESESGGFPIKYLTSASLMRLQLRDGAFRRHWLVQAALLLFYAAGGGRAEKDAPPLPTGAADGVKALESRVFAALEALPPDGAAFASAVRRLLAREVNWVCWKRDSCPAYERPPAPDGRVAPALTRKRRRRPAGSTQLGNPELDRLWNLGGNVACLTSPARQTAPALADFLAPVVEQGDPEAGIEETYKVKNDPVFCWRAARLIARNSLSTLGDERFNKREGGPGGGLLLAQHLEPVARKLLGLEPAAEATKEKDASKEATLEPEERAPAATTVAASGAEAASPAPVKDEKATESGHKRSRDAPS